MDLSSPIKDVGRAQKMFASRLEKLDIRTVFDLLYHIPSRYDDFSIISTIERLQEGEIVTIFAKVKEFKNTFLRSRKTLQKLTVSDETGEIEATFFNQPFLKQVLLPGTNIAISGRIEKFGKKITMQSPEYEIFTPGNEKETIHTGRLIPIYPTTKGITSKWLRRQIKNLLDTTATKNIDEYLPANILKDFSFPKRAEALKSIHFPKSFDEAKTAKNRLAFDELFNIQIKALQRKNEWKKNKKTLPLNIDDSELEQFIKSLPFTLTKTQEKAVSDIRKSLSKENAMNRLLQGDVGSGKTVVATIAMYIAFKNKRKSVLMAPTEILANQHFESIKKLVEPFHIKIELLTGTKKPENWKKTKKMKDYDILIGTHALLGDNVDIEDLSLVIIDEQQRFGVGQRGALRKKGVNPHLLTMTATPIPRTIALTIYGDLELSYLNELPKGRKTIKTWLVPKEKREAGYSWMEKEIIENKSQIFIICPFIEESENMTTVKAATKEFERLK